MTNFNSDNAQDEQSQASNSQTQNPTPGSNDAAASHGVAPTPVTTQTTAVADLSPERTAEINEGMQKVIMQTQEAEKAIKELNERTKDSGK